MIKRNGAGFTSLGAVIALGMLGAVTMVACGDSGGDGASTGSSGSSGTSGNVVDSAPNADAAAVTTTTFALGGTVTGLKGAGLVLANGTDTIDVAAPNGTTATFGFDTKLAAQASYEVTVKTQPSSPAQQCTVSGGTGTVVAGDVNSVTVNCATSQFTLGGTITGLGGSGLVITNTSNGTAATATINANGTFAFPIALDAGSRYAVSVATQPSAPSQSCLVTGGFGTINANVSDVAIDCTTSTFAVGGSISGLGAGKTIILANNGGDLLTRTQNGTFQFATPVASGAPYAVTVDTQPDSEHCDVTSAGTIVGASAVTDVAVVCVRSSVDTDYAGFLTAAAGTSNALVTGDRVSEPNRQGGFYFTLAAGITRVQITITGAAGSYGGANGGSGGTGLVELTPAFLVAQGKPGFWIIAGGAGKASAGGTAGTSAPYRAFNGGGAGTDWSNGVGTWQYSAGGGGGTDVRMIYDGTASDPTTGDPTTSFASRVAVVGGGGGSTLNGGMGGFGGGFNLVGGIGSAPQSYTPGTGGTLTAPGSIGAALGLGGDGLQDGTEGWAGGGGGGYYGGGASLAHFGGGGGSGYLMTAGGLTQVTTASGTQGANATDTTNGAFQIQAF